MVTDQELIEALAEEFPSLDPEVLSGSSNLKEELGLSSLDLVIVRAKIHDCFDVLLTDEQVIRSTYLGDLVKTINEGS